MNSNKNTNNLKKLKEGYLLIVFIILSAIASMIVMDVLVLPLTLFAINNKELFLMLFSNFFWLSIFIIAVLILIQQIRSRKNYDESLFIKLKHFLLRPFQILLQIIIIIITGLSLFGIIYIILSYNYYFIYRLIN